MERTHDRPARAEGRGDKTHRKDEKRMIKRFACALAAVVLLLSALGAAAFAEEDTANPLLAD